MVACNEILCYIPKLNDPVQKVLFSCQVFENSFTIAGPSTAGPSTAGPSTAGPSTADPSGAGPSEAGPSEAGPSEADPSGAGPSAADPSPAGPCEKYSLEQFNLRTMIGQGSFGKVIKHTPIIRSATPKSVKKKTV